MPRDTGSGPDPLAAINTIRKTTKPTASDGDLGTSSGHLLAMPATDADRAYEQAERQRAARWIRRNVTDTEEALAALGLDDVPDQDTDLIDAIATDLAPALQHAVRGRDRSEVARILQPLDRRELYAIAVVMAEMAGLMERVEAERIAGREGA